MTSHTSPQFRKMLADLPAHVREHAKEAFRQFQRDSQHPSLQFKRVGQMQPAWSVRIGIAWRAIGLRDGDSITWVWIGSHAAYDHVLSRY